MSIQHDDPLLTPEQAGIYLGRSESGAAIRFAYRLVAEGKIAHVKSGALLRFRKSALDDYLAANTVEPGPTLSDGDRAAVKRAPRRQGQRKAAR